MGDREDEIYKKKRDISRTGNVDAVLCGYSLFY